MEKFHVGDRVVCLTERDDRICAGDTGTICELGGWGDGWIGVAWDRYIGGHNCSGACEEGCGWAVPSDILGFEKEDTDPPFQFDEDAFNKLFS